MPILQADPQRILENAKIDLAAGKFVGIESLLSEPISLPLLSDLVSLELAHRIGKGERATAAEYLTRFPQGATAAAIALRWIAVEYQARRVREPALTEESLRQSYPEWSRLPEWDALVSSPDTLTSDHQSESTSLETFPGTDKFPPHFGDTSVWLKTILEPPPHPNDLGLFGDYRIQGILGQGGMGVVLRAFEQKLERPIALKLIRPEYAARSGSGERFLREARSAAAVLHQRIVPIFATGEVRGTPFLAMPLLKGQALTSFLRTQPGKKLPLSEALRLTREAAEGLVSAHAHGLTHRDIKPDNIWLEETTDGLHVRLLDFGLAHGGSTKRITLEGSIIGTPQYMAPEQAAGQTPDPKADLFSIGCILYEMLAGRRPFDGSDIIAVLNKIANHTPPPLQTIDPAIPASVSSLVDRLLEKEPKRRLDSAQKLVELIREIETTLSDLTTMPILLTTAAPKPPKRKRKWPYLYMLPIPLFAMIAGIFLMRSQKPLDMDVPSLDKMKVDKSETELRVKTFRIHHMGKITATEGRPLGIIGENSFDAKPGDQVTIDVELSKPAYAYLIAFRPDGVMELVSPDKENLPPAKSDQIHYPPADKVGKSYGLDDGAGLWLFAVAASDQPLPAYSSWAVEKPVAWANYPAQKGLVFHDNGSWIEVVTPLGTKRAKDQDALEANSPISKVMKYLKDTSKATTTVGWAFAVEP